MSQSKSQSQGSQQPVDLSLKNERMEVIGLTETPEMAIELKFTMMNGDIKYYTLKYTKRNMENSRFLCNSALRTFLFLNDIPTGQQDKVSNKSLTLASYLRCIYSSINRLQCFIRHFGKKS